jgi:transposase
VASRIDTMSVRDMVEALTGRFDDHHGELAAILLAQIDGLTAQIDQLTARISELITTIPAALGIDPDGTTGPHADRGPSVPVPPAAARLEEIPGISRHAAQVIIAEVGLDMTRFPTAAHLVSWARLCPRTIQSGARTRPGKTAKGNPYLKGVLGDAAAAAAKTPPSSVSAPAAGQAPRQAQSPGRHRPHPAGHHLAPARRPHRPLRRPRP